jgi:hypothetical protein
MAAQKTQGLLDLVDKRLGFGAHGERRPVNGKRVALR